MCSYTGELVTCCLHFYPGITIGLQFLFVALSSCPPAGMTFIIYMCVPLPYVCMLRCSNMGVSRSVRLVMSICCTSCSLVLCHLLLLPLPPLSAQPTPGFCPLVPPRELSPLFARCTDRHLLLSQSSAVLRRMCVLAFFLCE
jgi:hypothetical protein